MLRPGVSAHPIGRELWEFRMCSSPPSPSGLTTRQSLSREAHRQGEVSRSRGQARPPPPCPGPAPGSTAVTGPPSEPRSWGCGRKPVPASEAPHLGARQEPPLAPGWPRPALCAKARAYRSGLSGSGVLRGGAGAPRAGVEDAGRQRVEGRAGAGAGGQPGVGAVQQALPALLLEALLHALQMQVAHHVWGARGAGPRLLGGLLHRAPGAWPGGGPRVARLGLAGRAERRRVGPSATHPPTPRPGSPPPPLRRSVRAAAACAPARPAARPPGLASALRRRPSPHLPGPRLLF